MLSKTCKLGVDVRGSIALLSKYTFCSYRFAKSVLIAIKNGTEGQLLQRKTRCDAIHADTLWTDRIILFVIQPENSRACPGQERITIKYGARHPKYLLRKSPASIASDFLIAYPDCTYKSSTIIREFPQNAVTSTAKDCTRNNCPYHC